MIAPAVPSPTAVRSAWPGMSRDCKEAARVLALVGTYRRGMASAHQRAAVRTAASWTLRWAGCVVIAGVISVPWAAERAVEQAAFDDRLGNCRSEWAWRTTGGPPWTQGCWARSAGATRGRSGSGRSCGPPARPWPAGRSPRTSPPRSCRRTPATSTTPTQSPRRTAPSSGTRSSTGPSVGPRAAAWRGHPPRTRVVRAGRPPSAHPCARRGRLRRGRGDRMSHGGHRRVRVLGGERPGRGRVPAARASRPRLQQPPGPRDRRPDRTLHREERGPHPGADGTIRGGSPRLARPPATLRSAPWPRARGRSSSSPRPTRRGAWSAPACDAGCMPPCASSCRTASWCCAPSQATSARTARSPRAGSCRTKQRPAATSPWSWRRAITTPTSPWSSSSRKGSRCPTPPSWTPGGCAWPVLATRRSRPCSAGWS